MHFHVSSHTRFPNLIAVIRPAEMIDLMFLSYLMKVVMYVYAWGKHGLASTYLSVLLGVGSHVYLSSVSRHRNISYIWSSNSPHPGFFASDSLVVYIHMLSIVVPSLCRMVVICWRDFMITWSNWGIKLPFVEDRAVFDAPWSGWEAAIVFKFKTRF